MTSLTTVAVSGPDNVGKSTQLRILARRLYPEGRLVGPLHEYEGRWATITTNGMASWWFTTATTTELADVLAISYIARHIAMTAGGFWLIDRGIPMLEASLAATLSVRLDLDDGAGYDEALRLLRPYLDELRRCEARETGIVLLHSLDARDNAARSLAREVQASDTYRRYQHHLAVQVLRQAKEGRFAHTILVGERPIMAVQDELRAALHKMGVACPPGLLSQARIVALGGMSESGKSTAAD
jgi:hypothetical protein